MNRILKTDSSWEEEFGLLKQTKTTGVTPKVKVWGAEERLRLCDPFLSGQQKAWASFCLQRYFLKTPTWAMERNYCSIRPYHTF